MVSCLWGVYFLLVFLGVVVKSFVVLWVVMEVGLYVLVSLMFLESEKVSSVVLYYVVQTVGSGLMILGYMSSTCILDLGVSLKVGLFPFLYWVLVVVKELVAKVFIFVILGIQKLVPLIFILKFIHEFIIMDLILVVSSVVGVLFLVGFTDFFSVVSSSSIIHSSWLVVMVTSFPGLMWLYFIIYCFILLILIKVTKHWSFVVFSVFSSIPPMLGFYLKWVMFSDYVGSMWGVLGLMFLVSALSVLGYTFRFMALALTRVGEIV
uniref:NADH-ubiquinone oxidoreductase chain 2 n=1 Tax=Paratenuisentis ambiguus TaxID=185730 RepID=K3W3Y5_PARAB|nr:NADH dehydrogenase subunit 2 [Paratenuisentis ambiguus]CCA94490.2 NADH dehydrogenase subunit 2 [Paratenuisentis ambiguus]